MFSRITKERVIPAERGEVWAAFTSSEGARSFFAPEAEIDLRLGGRYHLLFDSEQPPGQQGSEGCRVLAFLPEELLTFEWNAPPQFAERDQHTFVVVALADAGPGATRVRLTHSGFGQGGAWPQVISYFERAWDLVLHWLEHRFRHGPIDWSAPPRP